MDFIENLDKSEENPTHNYFMAHSSSKMWGNEKWAKCISLNECSADTPSNTFDMILMF